MITKEPTYLAYPVAGKVNGLYPYIVLHYYTDEFKQEYMNSATISAGTGLLDNIDVYTIWVDREFKGNWKTDDCQPTLTPCKQDVEFLVDFLGIYYDEESADVCIEIRKMFFAKS